MTEEKYLGGMGMNNEEKILSILESMQTDISGLKEDVSDLKKDVAGLKEDVSGLKMDVSGLKEDVSVLKEDVSGLKEDVSGLKVDVSGMKEDVSGLKDNVSGIKIRLDADIQTQLNLLAEGHTRLAERLDTLDEVKELAEDTRDKVDVICTIVKQHSSEISLLKKAQ